jgi:hypothetical protein
MADLIPPPTVTSSTVACANTLLLPFLCLNSCITFEHDKGQYHKEYLGQHGSIYLFSYLTSINARKTGQFPCQIFRPFGLISAWRASSCLAMCHTLSFALLCPPLRLPLIPLLHLSVPSISIVNARHPSSSHLLILILIVRFGWRVSLRRSIAFSNLIHIKRLLLANIRLFKNKELLGLFQ